MLVQHGRKVCAAAAVIAVLHHGRGLSAQILAPELKPRWPCVFPGFRLPLLTLRLLAEYIVYAFPCLGQKPLFLLFFPCRVFQGTHAPVVHNNASLKGSVAHKVRHCLCHGRVFEAAQMGKEVPLQENTLPKGGASTMAWLYGRPNPAQGALQCGHACRKREGAKDSALLAHGA